VVVTGDAIAVVCARCNTGWKGIFSITAALPSKR
jgi:hypothetical protein